MVIASFVASSFVYHKNSYTPKIAHGWERTFNDIKTLFWYIILLYAVVVGDATVDFNVNICKDLKAWALNEISSVDKQEESWIDILISVLSWWCYVYRCVGVCGKYYVPECGMETEAFHWVEEIFCYIMLHVEVYICGLRFYIKCIRRRFSIQFPTFYIFIFNFNDWIMINVSSLTHCLTLTVYWLDSLLWLPLFICKERTLSNAILIKII